MTDPSPAAGSEPDYIVLRPSPDMPEDWMPAHLDGLWFDKATFVAMQPGDPRAVGISEPTGRFEVRDDGAVAEVYECRPRRATDE